MTSSLRPTGPEIVVPLHVEQLSLERRQVGKEGVRVHVRTTGREHPIDETLRRERIEVDRVAIGRLLEAVPPVREEGDTVVIPVVEEVVVVERRLILKEEIRVRRVRTTERHRESVILREQDVVIERTEPGGRARGQLPGTLGNETVHINQGAKQMNDQEAKQMNDETIVAVFDTPSDATAAIRALQDAGVDSSAITQHAGGQTTNATTDTEEPVRERGFWANLFGGEPEREHDASVYDRSLSGGSTVVTVKASEQQLTKVMDVLDKQNPIDIDERAASYGLSQTTTRTVDAPRTASAAADRTSEDATLQLAEETLAVGKRAINRGTTRVRRYVVETPVEEEVALRDETVSVERRPAADGRPVTNADFTDKTIEMTGTEEEAVVSKTARVKEEVVIRKDATERTKTVRDTVRREDVEITEEPGVEQATGATAGEPTMSNEAKP